MQYQTPQFIDIEDKIFGQLTAKQFLYIAGGGALAFLMWSLPIPRPIAIILAVPFAVLAVALAFQKVNNRPFVFVLESFFNYILSKKLYVWKKEPKAPKNKAETSVGNTTSDIPKISQSKLKELSWSLDINEKIKNSTVTKESERSLGLKI